MSGPKSSEYYLMQAEQRRLEMERQRRIEEERIRRQQENERQKAAQLLEEMTGRMNRKEAEIKVLHDDLLNCVNLTVYHQNVIDAKCELLSVLNGLRPFTGEQSVENTGRMLEYCDDAGRILQKVEKLQKEKLDKVGTELIRHVQEGDRLSSEQAFLQNAKDISVESATRLKWDLGKAEPEQGDARTSAVIRRMEEAAAPYLAEAGFPERDKVVEILDSARQIASHPSYDTEYKYAQVSLRCQALLAAQPLYDTAMNEYRRLLASVEYEESRHAALCHLLGQTDDQPVASRDANHEARLKLLQTENERLDALLKRREENRYIADSVNAVMEEMGYDILAEEFLTMPNRNVSRQVYGLTNSTGINVYVSDNGSLMFEVSGIGDQSRQATSNEKLKIKEGMEKFCPEYAVIREKLKARGIGMANEILREPDEKFAKVLKVVRDSVKRKNTKKGTALHRQEG